MMALTASGDGPTTFGGEAVEGLGLKVGFDQLDQVASEARNEPAKGPTGRGFPMTQDWETEGRCLPPRS